jgi:regulator of sirC expression with transglutaminase-like and TPR domain
MSDHFDREVGRLDKDINLARAGLAFAKSEYPALDEDWYLAQFGLIADQVIERLPRNASQQDRLDTAINFLFEDLGFAGNLEDYYDPRNSFINEVLDRRTGIPITLSIVFLELAERLGLPARGVSFPGHFLVCVQIGCQDVIVDPFDGGITLDRDTFVARLKDRTDGTATDTAIDAMLETASNHDILLRQLRNLKAIYTNLGDRDRRLNVVNHMLLVDGYLSDELIERAGLLEEVGSYRSAVEDYERAILCSPSDELVNDIVLRRQRAQQRIRRLH